jgi:Sulfatase
MRYAGWADAINPALARIVKARYYGEITYLDHCLGRILDAVEACANSENTLICFSSDHGDLLGDHHGWQKQNFFETSCRIPVLLSWPLVLPAGIVRRELISLFADLFGIATQAGGHMRIARGDRRSQNAARGIRALPTSSCSSGGNMPGPWCNGRSGRQQASRFSISRTATSAHLPVRSVARSASISR